MISETITLPKTIAQGEDRFIVKLKENLLRMIKEINRNSKKIDKINNTEIEETDYTDEFNSKANVNASNIGYGDLFEPVDEYDSDANRLEWGRALTNDKNTIAEDNETLISSQNVYDETHPYMSKDGQGKYINPYHYINYKNLTRHEGAEDINKQDRWSEQDFFQPHEPNDNKVKENLIALDTAVYEVSQELDKKANITLNNINDEGKLVISDIARDSILVQADPELAGTVWFEKTQRQTQNGNRDIYTLYVDYDPPTGLTMADLLRETRGYLRDYDVDWSNYSFVDKDWTAARNLYNLNEVLVAAITTIADLRHELLNTSTGYTFDGDGGLYWSETISPDSISTYVRSSHPYKYVISGTSDIRTLGVKGRTDVLSDMFNNKLNEYPEVKYLAEKHETEINGVSGIKKKIEDMQDEIDTINTNIQNIQDTIDDIQEKITDFETRIQALERAQNNNQNQGQDWDYDNP